VIGIPNLDRRTKRHEDTRAEIVAAAWDVAALQGVGGINMRDLAARVGLKAPSLYEYFPSKHAIYDAMFADGWRAFRVEAGSLERQGDSRTLLSSWARQLARFWTSHPARFSLLCQRPIPGFVPSAEAYAQAVAALADLTAVLAAHSVIEAAAVDLFIAMQTGLVSQQIANDPGGDRWLRLIDRSVHLLLTSMSNTLQRQPRWEK
jgi:AcrR family transcriptional regulator